MVIVETSFPRGGTVNFQPRTDKISFGARQEKRKKGKATKKQKESRRDETVEEIKAVSAEMLSHKTIQEGMLVMGIVKSVDPTFLKISLPGRIVGRVMAPSISESYNKVMRKYVEGKDGGEDFKPLPELFHVGQTVYVKIMAITNTDHGRLIINLSLKPSDVHANFNHQGLRKGQLFNGAVEEIQEHGYIIETGVSNLRCFLPFGKSSDGLKVGQLIYMKIETLTQTSTASTAICKAVVGENRRIKDFTDPKLDYIVPTTVVNFTISKILKDGLQGTIMNGQFTGYINEHQLNDVMQVPDDCEPNTTIRARILYVMPLTKLVYLSLRINEATDDEIQYKRGDIIEDARVHHIGTGGIILNLNDNGKGLISFKSIKLNYIGNYDQDEMLSKYKKNSKHKVRIMEYDYVDSLYTCSDNPIVVNEPFYALGDLKPGDFITGIIEESTFDGGYRVRIGNVRGLIEKMFLASSACNLQENAKIRCRVIAINRDRNVAYLTNRSEYMAKTAKLLTKLSEVKINRIYTGTIVKSDEKCFIVRFFSNIKAILYTNQIANELTIFYVGATMNFRIVSRTDEKIVVGLVEDIHKMGEIYEAKVTNIIQNGLEIAIEGEDGNQIKGLVPVRLLSEFPELVVGHLKSSYSLVDKLTVVCILRNIYSVRDVDYFKMNAVKQWRDIRRGDILKGFIKNVDGNIIEIMLPILNYETLIKIHSDMLLENCISEPNIMLVPEQVVFVKILSKENITKTLTVSGKLHDVWDCELKSTGDCFARFLQQVRSIRKNLKACSRPIAVYKVGDQVSGRVIICDPNHKDWYLELKNGVCGVIKAVLAVTDKSISVGMELNCVVLWIDYSTDVVYLSHKPSDIAHISSGFKLPANYKNSIGINGKVLLKTVEFTVCSIKKGPNPIVFVPARLHFNDFESTVTENIKEGEFCRLAFIHDQFSIAVFESTWKLCQRLKVSKRSAVKKLQDKELVATKKQKLLKDEGDGVKTNLKITANYDSLVENFNIDSDDLEKSNLFFKDTGRTGSKSLTLGVNSKRSASKKLQENEQVVAKKQKLLRDEDDGANLSLKIKTNCVTSAEDFDSGSDDSEESVRRGNKSTTTVINTKVNTDGNGSESDDSPKKKRQSTEIQRQSIEQQKIGRKKKTALLPGANGFWSTNLDTLSQNTREQMESSDDDNTTDLSSQQKKKKQTAAEKFRQAREEEARLRKIEENYADPNMKPETADQFDRLVLTNPNSSETWINYMVFHLQATEIDKARLIGRKALKSISFREEQELINIWIALLNLELRYGTKESFTEILKESTLYMDAYTIYTRCLEILTDAKKINELNEMIPIVTKKFKDKPDIWKNSANAYFKVGLTEKAKQLLHKALAVLPERDHINTIATFANLNYKNDDKEMAHTLLEQIVTSYPKRVDIWSQYVDMLIKDNEIESARRTLERAVVQKIPMKKMRTLFKKYLEFEERHGSEENVQNVKQMAANYVKNEIKS